MSILAKRSPISATADLLFVFSFLVTLFVFRFRVAVSRQIKLAIRQLLGARKYSVRFVPIQPTGRSVQKSKHIKYNRKK